MTMTTITRPTHCTDCCKPFASESCWEFMERWKILVPPDYQKADALKVRKSLSSVPDWKPDGKCQGIGIHGPPGSGKTHVMALLARRLHTPFRWVTGSRLRSVYTEAATLDGEEQVLAKRKFHRFKTTPLLIIDDILEVPFTATWMEALFELLEYRNSHKLLTCWTAQHGEGQIAPRIAGGKGEMTTAEAIERRLIQHHAVYAA